MIDYNDMNRKVDAIVRNEKLSDYEKGLQIMYEVGFLFDERDELKKKVEELTNKKKELEKEVSDAGWQREYDHADDWRKVTEMGMC